MCVKKKKNRKGGRKRRKREERGGEIVSYETDSMWLRVFQGLFVFNDGTTAFPCQRH